VLVEEVRWVTVVPDRLVVIEIAVELREPSPQRAAGLAVTVFVGADHS
jgi:hypothetical protein